LKTSMAFLIWPRMLNTCVHTPVEFMEASGSVA